jgi:PAS domain-containing protein
MTDRRINNKSSIRNILLPALFLVIALWLDHKTPGITITPLFAGVGILVMAFQLPLPWMAFWTVSYTACVLAVFLLPVWGFLIAWYSPPVSMMTQYIRAFSFIATAVLGVGFCRTLARQRGVNDELKMLLEKLPVPVITSDRNGVVKFMNHSMAQLLGRNGGRDGATFFDLLAPRGRQGETISSYLSRFSARSKNSDSTIQVQIHGQEYLARTRLMESSVPQIMVSVIEEKSPR